MSKRKFTSFVVAATVATLIPAASANAHAARNEHPWLDGHDERRYRRLR